MNKLKFKDSQLIPTIIQDQLSGEVYMLGYMNEESYKMTIKTKYVWFWSRSRKKLWMKGEESGNKLKVLEIYCDCDSDTLLIKINLIGKNVCHTGNQSCFYQKLKYDTRKTL